MYKLSVTFKDGSKMKKDYTEPELRKAFDRKFKKGIKYAVVITPSGVTKDVTKILDPFAF